MSDDDKMDFDYLLHNPGEIIAEIACGYEGDINKLKLLIDAISFSGAKIVNFKYFLLMKEVPLVIPSGIYFRNLV